MTYPKFQGTPMAGYGAGAYVPDKLRSNAVSGQEVDAGPATGSGPARINRERPHQLGSSDESHGFELIDGGRLLLVLLKDTERFDSVVKLLEDKITASLELPAKQRVTGLIVLRKGVVLSSKTSQTRLRELASSRIMVRTSEDADLNAGARQIQKQVMDNYAIAANHLHSKAVASASSGAPSH